MQQGEGHSLAVAAVTPPAASSSEPAALSKHEKGGKAGASRTRTHGEPARRAAVQLVVERLEDALVGVHMACSQIRRQVSAHASASPGCVRCAGSAHGVRPSSAEASRAACAYCWTGTPSQLGAARRHDGLGPAEHTAVAASLTVQDNVNAGVVQERLQHLPDAVGLAEVRGVRVVLQQGSMHARDHGRLKGCGACGSSAVAAHSGAARALKTRLLMYA